MGILAYRCGFLQPSLSVIDQSLPKMITMTAAPELTSKPLLTISYFMCYYPFDLRVLPGMIMNKDRSGPAPPQRAGPRFRRVGGEGT